MSLFFQIFFFSRSCGFFLFSLNFSVYPFLISKVNSYISVPRDKASLNPANFQAGVLSAVLNGSNFPCTVVAHWHGQATYYVIEFNDLVIQRDKL